MQGRSKPKIREKTTRDHRHFVVVVDIIPQVGGDLRRPLRDDLADRQLGLASNSAAAIANRRVNSSVVLTFTIFVRLVPSSSVHRLGRDDPVHVVRRGDVPIRVRWRSFPSVTRWIPLVQSPGSTGTERSRRTGRRAPRGCRRPALEMLEQVAVPKRPAHPRCRRAYREKDGHRRGSSHPGTARSRPSRRSARSRGRNRVRAMVGAGIQQRLVDSVRQPPRRSPGAGSFHRRRGHWDRSDRTRSPCSC